MKALQAHSGTAGMPGDRAGDGITREAFDRLLGEIRPKLHRYAARMTGSVIDGEDVVQEALIKAIEAFPEAAPIANPEGWLFRIAHNAALDYLRRRARRETAGLDEETDMADPADPVADRQIAAASLRTFMRLPPAQRSSVILMDVLGYSLQEIGGVLDTSIASVKAALHRGRARLRELADEPDDRPQPAMTERSARCSASISTASMRATSTPCATCWPTRCGSILSPGPGCKGARRSAPTSTTMLTPAIGVSRWVWWTAARRRSPAIPTIARQGRCISSCSAGRTAGC